MRTTNRWISLIALVLVLGLMFGLVACGDPGETDANVDPAADSGTPATDDTADSGTPATDNTDEEEPYVLDVQLVEGQIIVIMSDGTEKNLGAAVTNVTENDVTVNAGTEDVTPYSASRALLSTVGIECGFTVTQYISTGFYGGYITRDAVTYSFGSGVIYSLDKASGDAYIITNYHVVYNEDAKEEGGISQMIAIYMLGDSETIEATFIGGSSKYDIAVLEVKGSARLAASAAQAVTVSPDTVVAGMGTLVVGNANGEGISVTRGIVSVDSESIVMSSITDSSVDESWRVIRNDAAVNPGNSGGGLFDSTGRLIGIINAKLVNEDTEGMGYAIPVDIAVTIAEKVLDGDMDENKNTNRVLLGITVEVADSKMAYDAETGLVHIVETVKIAYDRAATSSSNEVIGVTSGGLGDLAGLQSGDTIIDVTVGTHETRVVTRQFHIIDEVLKARSGDTISITVLREVEGVMESVVCSVVVP